MGNLKKTYGRQKAVNDMRDALMDKARKKYRRRMACLRIAYLVSIFLWFLSVTYGLACCVENDAPRMGAVVVCLALEALPLIVFAVKTLLKGGHR